jgi:hypothetical protein
MLSNGNGERADAAVYSEGMGMYGGYGKLASVAEVIGGSI